MPVSVLIADDDPNIVLALKFLMEKAGYRVRAVPDGQSAVAALAEERARPGAARRDDARA